MSDTFYSKLAAANTFAADQYFKSGRPWFDIVAFGADPTGAADSTAAIQSAINAALGLRTDTGVSMTASSTAVTDSFAVSGDVGKYVNHPNFPLGSSLITAVTSSPVGYTVATAATATLSGLTPGIGSNPIATGRVPAGGVYAPAGTFKVSADLLVTSVTGFRLFGAGTELTSFQATGTGFTNAVLNINGSLMGTYGGFTIKGDSTDQVSNAVILQYDSTRAARSTSQNLFENIRVRNLNFVNGINLGFNTGTPQVDGTTFLNIVVSGSQAAGSWSGTGNWLKGIILGNGNQGNNYDHVLYNVSWSGCNTGLSCAASGFELYGSQPGSNAVDFALSPGTQISINGVQSQNSAQFITGSGGSGVVLVSVRDAAFKTTFLISTGKWVSTAGGSASWLFENVACYSAGTGGIGGTGVPLMAFSGSGAKENVTLVNVMQFAPPATGVTISSGGSLMCVNYVQLNSSNQAGALFPLYCLNANALYQQGVAASRPTASAVGENFYYATDTTVFSHSDGSSWTNIAATSVVPPDIQFFTAGGTWTKPAGAQTTVVTIAGGGGGGSGYRGGSVVRCGGGGGGGAAIVTRQFASADLGATVAVTIGAGGTGGAAVTADTTAGNPGTSGVASAFGTLCFASNGLLGAGGSTTAGAGGSGGAGMVAGSTGGSASTTGAAGNVSSTAAGATGGGSGGGITTGSGAASNGGVGSASFSGSSGNNGSAGVVDTTSPGTGAAITVKGTPGCGGGGGASSVTTAAQAGAAPAGYGGGGGGGGASLNGNNSGAGGNGAAGFALIVSYFQ